MQLVEELSLSIEKAQALGAPCFEISRVMVPIREGHDSLSME